MKKMWNTPDIQELTIQSTTCTGWAPGGWGNNGWGNGGWGSHKPGRPGYGNDNLCRCEGGTSPCSKHHGSFPGLEDEMS